MFGHDFPPSQNIPPAFWTTLRARRLTNRCSSPRRPPRRQIQPRRRLIGSALAQALPLSARQLIIGWRSRFSSSSLPAIVLLSAQRLPRLNQRHHWTKEPPDEASAASINTICAIGTSGRLHFALNMCHQRPFSASPTHIVGSGNITPMLLSRLMQP